MDIPFDLLNIVASYLVRPKMKILDWLDKDKLNWSYLTENPGAIDVLEKMLKQPNTTLDWKHLSRNPNAVHLLRTHPDKINIDKLEYNANIMHILEILKMDYAHFISGLNDKLGNQYAIPLLEIIVKDNPEKINWFPLSHSSYAFSSYAPNNSIDIVHFIEKHIDKLDYHDWFGLSSNPDAVYLCEKYLDKVNWHQLSTNHNAIHLLEKYFDKLSWDSLSDKISWDSLSTNRNAIHILEKHPEKINWLGLLKNPNALGLLEANPDKIREMFLLSDKYIINKAKHLISMNENVNILNAFLKDHPERIDWTVISENKNIFEIDKQQIYIDSMMKAKNLDYNT